MVLLGRQTMSIIFRRASAFILRGARRMLAILLGIFVCASSTATAAMVTITCEDPAGINLYHGPDPITGKAVESEATSSSRFGDRPRFILDTEHPEYLLVLWRGYIPEDLEPLLDPKVLAEKATKATIVARDADQITAIEVHSQGVYAYSLFPKLSYGVFSNHARYTNGQIASWFGRISVVGASLANCFRWLKGPLNSARQIHSRLLAVMTRQSSWEKTWNSIGVFGRPPARRAPVWN